MRHPVSVLALATALIGVAACTKNANDADTGAIKVSSTADACVVGATGASSGHVVFEVTNDGSQVTEFYLLADDGHIVGEVEDIGPGITRNLAVDVTAGSYTTTCKPGMTGEGISAPFTVTD